MRVCGEGRGDDEDDYDERSVILSDKTDDREPA